MIIEFADPGYNFGYMWWAIGLGVLGIVMFFLPFFYTQDERKIAAWPMVGLSIFLAASILPVFGGSAYDSTVRDSTKYRVDRSRLLGRSAIR